MEGRTKGLATLAHQVPEMQQNLKVNKNLSGGGGELKYLHKNVKGEGDLWNISHL